MCVCVCTRVGVSVCESVCEKGDMSMHTCNISTDMIFAGCLWGNPWVYQYVKLTVTWVPFVPKKQFWMTSS